MLLDYMDYVYAVYQERSFSKAAQKLYVSQPWLSATVKKVEREIQLPIFNRNTNPISLTEAGSYYIQCVEKVILVQNEMRAHFSELVSLSGTQFHIGSSMFFCTYVLPRILSSFRDAYPQITLSFSESDSNTLLERLQQGKLDFVLEAEAPDNPVLNAIVWATEEIILAVPAKFAINKTLQKYSYTFEAFLSGQRNGWSKPPVPLEYFKDQEFILLKRGNDIFKRGISLCKNAGFTPKASSYLEQMMTAYYLVCESRGITFLRSTIPQYVTPTDHVVFYRLGDPLAIRNLYLTFRKNNVSPAQQDLIDFMKRKKLMPAEQN